MNDSKQLPCKSCPSFAICLPDYLNDLPPGIPHGFDPLDSIFFFMNKCKILSKWALSKDIISIDNSAVNIFKEFHEYFKSHGKEEEKR